VPRQLRRQPSRPAEGGDDHGRPPPVQGVRGYEPLVPPADPAGVGAELRRVRVGDDRRGRDAGDHERVRVGDVEHRGQRPEAAPVRPLGGGARPKVQRELPGGLGELLHRGPAQRDRGHIPPLLAQDGDRFAQKAGAVPPVRMGVAPPPFSVAASANKVNSVGKELWDGCWGERGDVGGGVEGCCAEVAFDGVHGGFC